MSNRWDSDLYEESHSFVHEYGADVVGLLAPEAGERILDLGCGTGHLTAEIAEAGAEVVGVDSAADMISQAREAYPDLEFVEADARDLPDLGTFDAVFSNAALHWIPEGDQSTVAEEVRELLRSGGRFVAELGGYGNVETIVAALEAELEAAGYEVADPWYFPTVGEHTSLLESRGFEPTYATLFDRPTELEGDDGLRNWLSMFGDSFFADVPDDDREEIITAAEDEIRPEIKEGDRWVADYRRLRFVARNEPIER